MSHRYVIGILAVGLLALGGWALAQQDRPGPKAPVPEGGPFAVSPAGQLAVLLDTKSGKTWVLTRSVEGQSIWLPARRIDSEKEARDWQELEKHLQQILAEKNRAENTKADADDDTLRHYLSKSEAVVVGQVTDGLQKIGVDFGSTYPVRVVEFEFKVSDGIKGKIAAKRTIHVIVTRAVDSDAQWVPRQGDRFVLFLKPSGKSWTSADKWFGVQPHSEAFVTHLKRLRDQPAVPPKSR